MSTFDHESEDQTAAANALVREFGGQNPPRRRHHRVNYNERKFWESCVLVCLGNADLAEKAIDKADTAGISWKKRWDRPEDDE